MCTRYYTKLLLSSIPFHPHSKPYFYYHCVDDEKYRPKEIGEFAWAHMENWSDQIPDSVSSATSLSCKPRTPSSQLEIKSYKKLRDDRGLSQDHTLNLMQTFDSFHTIPRSIKVSRISELSRKVPQLELKSGGPHHKDRSSWSLSFFLWYSFWNSPMLF